MSGAATAIRVKVRALRMADLDDVIRIDELHTGERKAKYWRRVFGLFLRSSGEARRIGLAAEGAKGIDGYLLGETRAFEFGSEPCGWVFAIGVDPSLLRAGIATSLLDEARKRFRKAGIAKVRTMVRREDIPVLSFFRASGFAGGSFVQLEQDLEMEES